MQDLVEMIYLVLSCKLMSWQEGSDSEQESNDGMGTSRKSLKRPRGKLRPNSSKPSEGHFLSPSQLVASSSDCLSLLKKKRSVGMIMYLDNNF